jgi:hypothetical protein
LQPFIGGFGSRFGNLKGKPIYLRAFLLQLRQKKRKTITSLQMFQQRLHLETEILPGQFVVIDVQRKTKLLNLRQVKVRCDSLLKPVQVTAVHG